MVEHGGLRNSVMQDILPCVCVLRAPVADKQVENTPTYLPTLPCTVNAQPAHLLGRLDGAFCSNSIRHCKTHQDSFYLGRQPPILCTFIACQYGMPSLAVNVTSLISHSPRLIGNPPHPEPSADHFIPSPPPPPPNSAIQPPPPSAHTTTEERQPLSLPRNTVAPAQLPLGRPTKSHCEH